MQEENHIQPIGTQEENKDSESNPVNEKQNVQTNTGLGFFDMLVNGFIFYMLMQLANGC
jgi:hypothetical protein